MRHKLTKFACSGLLAFGLAIAGAPASAAPAAVAAGAFGSETSRLPLVRVDYDERLRVHHRRHWRHGRHHRHWHHTRPHVGIYLEFGRPAPHYYMRPRPVRPYYRPHYRPQVSLARAHVRWCYARYRSYRAWDNSFQPYHGPRRECFSPYGR